MGGAPSRVNWSAFRNHDALRQAIADVVPGFSAIKDIGTTKKEFTIEGRIRHTPEFPLPGGRAKAHLHENHETAIYVLSGRAEMWYGEGLREHLFAEGGDFIYIPAGVPHLPANASATEVCVAVLARTDPNEQESVVLRPDLDALAGR